MNKKEQILKAIECFNKGTCIGKECYYFTESPTESPSCDIMLKDVYEYIHSLLDENNKLRDALGSALDCIAECDYSLTKINNSRVESAVREWETYAIKNNVYNLLRGEE